MSSPGWPGRMGAPSRLHAAVAGFDAGAEAYERGRPDYPVSAVEYLRSQLGISAGHTVVEVGAGTGKFTRALEPWGARRIAVEPTDAMRRVFRQVLPHVPVLSATAERLPFRDGSADAVVVAQAFHWFRQPESLRELARVLRPAGALGLVWNVRDESVPWAARLGAIIEAESGGIPRHRSGSWKSAFDAEAQFSPPVHRSFPYLQSVDLATLVDRVLSVSVIALLPPERQREVADRVRELANTDPACAGRTTFGLPYRTDVYVARRRANG